MEEAALNALADLAHRLHAEELELLQQLRGARRARTPPAGPHFSYTLINIILRGKAWDPYPFILLNLFLSMLAAIQAPVIMMSQNRQAAIDRADAKTDYAINEKAELEIELLHQKIDLLRQTELSELVKIITKLEARLPLPAER